MEKNVYTVSSIEMAPKLLKGDRVILEKISKRDLEDGDIVVFEYQDVTYIRIYSSGNRPMFVPQNKRVLPMAVPEKYKLIGRVVGVEKNHNTRSFW